MRELPSRVENGALRNSRPKGLCGRNDSGRAFSLVELIRRFSDGRSHGSEVRQSHVTSESHDASRDGGELVGVGAGRGGSVGHVLNDLRDVRASEAERVQDGQQNGRRRGDVGNDGGGILGGEEAFNFGDEAEHSAECVWFGLRKDEFQGSRDRHDERRDCGACGLLPRWGRHLDDNEYRLVWMHGRSSRERAATEVPPRDEETEGGFHGCWENKIFRATSTLES